MKSIILLKDDTELKVTENNDGYEFGYEFDSILDKSLFNDSNLVEIYINDHKYSNVTLIYFEISDNTTKFAIRRKNSTELKFEKLYADLNYISAMTGVEL